MAVHACEMLACHFVPKALTAKVGASKSTQVCLLQGTAEFGAGAICETLSADVCDRWSDVVRDLSCKSPAFLDIRKLRLGVQKLKTTKTTGLNNHCLMEFRRVSCGRQTDTATTDEFTD